MEEGDTIKLKMTMQVAEKPCENCLFSDARIVSLEMAEEIVETCLKNDNYFICHKSSMNDGKVCCRRFYDLHKQKVLPLRLAGIFGITAFVALPKTAPLVPYNKQNILKK